MQPLVRKRSSQASSCVGSLKSAEFAEAMSIAITPASKVCFHYYLKVYRRGAGLR